MNSNLKKTTKCLLLYGTLLYFCIFLICAEALFNYNSIYFVNSFVILIILICFNHHYFEGDNLENYVPKWFR